MTTTLPDDYFNAVESPVGQEDMASGLTLPGERKASSENKVYEVGSPTAGSEKNGVRTPAVGLKDTRRQLMMHASGQLDIELEEQVYELDEVAVSASRMENVRSTTLGVTRLKMTEIKNIPTAFGEADILKVVMSLPGVLLLFNGGTVYNPTHLFGLFSVFNPDLVQDMELYKSSIPAKFGGRISSVLDINTRVGNKEEFKGSASIGLLTSRLTLEGPLFPEKSDDNDGRAGFYDLNASIDHRFDENNSLTLSGYFSHDRFSFDDAEKYAYQNASASARWVHAFSPSLTAILTAGYDHYNNHTENSENPATAYDLDFGIDQYHGQLDFEWQAHEAHQLSFGASALALSYGLNPGEYLAKGDASLVLDDRLQREKALESALYVGDKWDITPALSVEGGVRYSMFNAIGPRSFRTYEPDRMPSPSTVLEEREETGFYQTYHGPEFRLRQHQAADRPAGGARYLQELRQLGAGNLARGLLQDDGQLPRLS